MCLHHSSFINPHGRIIRSPEQLMSLREWTFTGDGCKPMKGSKSLFPKAEAVHGRKGEWWPRVVSTHRAMVWTVRMGSSGILQGQGSEPVFGHELLLDEAQHFASHRR